MVIDSQKLRGKMVEKGYDVVSLSQAAGINRATFYRKIKGSKSFEIGEVHRICDKLSLTREEAISIFFPQYSH